MSKHVADFKIFNTCPKKATATEGLICSVQDSKLLPEASGNVEEKGDGYCQKEQGLEKLL